MLKVMQGKYDDDKSTHTIIAVTDAITCGIVQNVIMNHLFIRKKILYEQLTD